jgi:hypothetical protein
VSTHSRLEDGVGYRDRQQVVFAWLDGIEPVGKQRERTLDASIHDDALPHRLKL